MVSRSDIPKVFTWWGHSVSMNDAKWLSSMKFTEVVVRGVNDLETKESYNNLRTFDIVFWRHLGPPIFFNCTEKLDFLNIIRREIEKSLTRKLYLDDAHGVILNSSKYVAENFVSAVHDYCDDIVMAFSTLAWRDIKLYYRHLDFSGLDIDIYGYLPCENATEILADAKSKVRTLGTALWAYSGYDWESPKLTPSMVSDTYRNARKYAVRMTVWTGDEYGELRPSSLYQHNQWWNQIQSLNNKWTSS